MIKTYELKEKIKSNSHNSPFNTEDGHHWPAGTRFQAVNRDRELYYKQRYPELVSDTGLVLEQIGGEEVVVLVNEDIKDKFKEVSPVRPSDYNAAVTVQSACNLSGIVFSFAEIMHRICAEAQQEGHGTDWKNNHPICRLFAEQIYYLTNRVDWFEAYRIAEEEAKKGGETV